MKRIIISRTDSLGDVTLTLPVAGVLKETNPDCEIIFLGSDYTESLVKGSSNIDKFINWSEITKLSFKQQLEIFKELKADAIIHVFPRIEITRLASKAKIPLRIGTSRRPYNFLYCNKLVKLSRKKSNLHESQLNLKLITPIGGKDLYNLSEIPEYYGLSNVQPLKPELEELLSKDKINIILHPKSKGSGREWGLENYLKLIDILPAKYKIFITGTKDEGLLIQELFLNNKDKITNLTGKLSLSEFISFINAADGLIACSTGPLHIASALGKFALGLYPPMRPLFPQRWKPIGTNAHYLVIEKDNCKDCKKTKDCNCIKSIKPEEVLYQLSINNNQ